MKIDKKRKVKLVIVSKYIVDAQTAQIPHFSVGFSEFITSIVFFLTFFYLNSFVLLSLHNSPCFFCNLLEPNPITLFYLCDEIGGKLFWCNNCDQIVLLVELFITRKGRPLIFYLADFCYNLSCFVKYWKHVNSHHKLYVDDTFLQIFLIHGGWFNRQILLAQS